MSQKSKILATGKLLKDCNMKPTSLGVMNTLRIPQYFSETNKDTLDIKE